MTQLGLTVMVPVFLCILAGRYLDSRFGLNLTFFLMVLGFLAGMSGAWRLAASVSAMERKERERERNGQLEKWKTEHPSESQAKCPKRQSRVIKQKENLHGKKYEEPDC